MTSSPLCDCGPDEEPDLGRPGDEGQAGVCRGGPVRRRRRAAGLGSEPDNRQSFVVEWGPPGRTPAPVDDDIGAPALS
jgi:hypothetical protein